MDGWMDGYRQGTHLPCESLKTQVLWVDDRSMDHSQDHFGQESKLPLRGAAAERSGGGKRQLA